ncbi:MAG: hypothetical protein AB7O72_11245 [Ramlibacter sp.]
MFPWLMYWAPQFQFPFSGSVAQEIAPDTSWFFGAIRPEAGNGEVEKKIFDVASYGRQIGLLTEVVLALKDDPALTQEQAEKSLHKLHDIYLRIEQVKAGNAADLEDAAARLLDQLRRLDPARHERLLARTRLLA